MKHLRLALFCAALVLACMLTMVACGGNNTPAETTADTTAADTTVDTVADTVADTEAAEVETTIEDGTTVEDETTLEDGTTAEEETGAGLVSGDYFDDNPETPVVINNAAELMAFHDAINNADPNEYWFWDETVIFTADIDMTGYEWTPIKGIMMDNVTFDGQGHTISNLTFQTYKKPYPEAPAAELGCGFIDIAVASLTFKNLTLDSCTITAHERAVGNFVGLVCAQGEALISFENCKSSNFTVDGWMDRNAESKEDLVYISFRQAGFIGHLMAGATATFKNCVVEDIKLSGYHNMAGFVGYDGTNTIDEYSFENCSVSGAEFTFSYGMGLSDGKTVETFEKKYVSVFFNGAEWVDKIDACVDMGNTYDSISYYDWFNNNQEYTPADFRSWTGNQEDAAA